MTNIGNSSRYLDQVKIIELCFVRVMEAAFCAAGKRQKVGYKLFCFSSMDALALDLQNFQFYCNFRMKRQVHTLRFNPSERSNPADNVVC